MTNEYILRKDQRNGDDDIAEHPFQNTVLQNGISAHFYKSSKVVEKVPR